MIVSLIILWLVQSLGQLWPGVHWNGAIALAEHPRAVTSLGGGTEPGDPPHPWLSDPPATVAAYLYQQGAAPVTGMAEIWGTFQRGIPLQPRI